MGRKAETPYNGPRRSIEVCIGEGDVEYLRALGGGNVSEGMRRVIALAKQDGARKDTSDA